MAEITTDDVRNYLQKIQGQIVTLPKLRAEFGIMPGSRSFDAIRTIMFRLVEQKVVRTIGHRGEYKVVIEVKPVRVFGKERHPPIRIAFPKDQETGTEMFFAQDIVLREGDLILLSGRSNFGKTTLCMNFCGENIDLNPVLMGNEYTTIDGEASSRFLNRIDNMDWVKWANDDGEDRFSLLPVRDDYAEHIVKDKINIIDWINIETGEHYMISAIMESIKRELGKGVAIVAIQKAEGADSGRGGQFTKDFADVELLLDKLPESDDVLLTVGKVKESNNRVAGRTFAYGISKGVKITHFREVEKCPACHGKGWVKFGMSSKPCQQCWKSGYIDKQDIDF